MFSLRWGVTCVAPASPTPPLLFLLLNPMSSPRRPLFAWLSSLLVFRREPTSKLRRFRAHPLSMVSGREHSSYFPELCSTAPQGFFSRTSFMKCAVASAVLLSACQPPPSSGSSPTDSAETEAKNEQEREESSSPNGDSASATLTCHPDGSPCDFDDQCCEGHCGRMPGQKAYCKPRGSTPSCRPEGHECKGGADCCTSTCITDPRLGRVCKPADATSTCFPRSRACTFDNECCSGTCIQDPRLGRICK